MNDLTRKAINFDLDTKIMKEKGVYPNGYNQVEKSFIKHDFVHEQGSGYASKYVIDSYGVEQVIKKVVKENPWLADCVNKYQLA